MTGPLIFAPDALAGLTADEVAEFLTALTDRPDTIGVRPVGPCPCECNDNPPQFCGGCGHAGCGMRRRTERGLR